MKEKTKEYLLSKANKYDRSEATMEQRLERYALAQKPLNGVESVANIDDSLERHMPRTSKKSFIAVCLLSPVLCLLAWGIAVYACISSD